MIQRLQKILASRGVASRRACEKMISDGRVTVNGIVVTLGDSADEKSDVILLDGKPLPINDERVYIMLNKPRGYVTTMSDERGRKTVAELVADCGVRVYPVGRLDYNSEGLLLMTNDGALTNKITHPSNEKSKTYIVSVRGDLHNVVQRMSQPMVIDGYKIKPATVSLVRQNCVKAELEITIHEGRNRQIRKMCSECGLTVLRLVRVAEEGLKLADLPSGTWRYLTEAEKMHILQRKK